MDDNTKIIIAILVLSIVTVISLTVHYILPETRKHRSIRRTHQKEQIPETQSEKMPETHPEQMPETRPGHKQETYQEHKQETYQEHKQETYQEHKQETYPEQHIPKVHQESYQEIYQKIHPEQRPSEMKMEIKMEPVPLAVPVQINTSTYDWITEHNRIRNDVGQKPVSWNQPMANNALNSASKCIFDHSPQSSRTIGNTILCENLAYGSPGKNYDEKKIVGMWESEKQYFKYPQYPSNGTGKETGHYTQIINKNVKEIGCGCFNCGDNKMCVCRYNPIQLGNEYPY